MDLRPIDEREQSVLVFTNSAGDPVVVPSDVATAAERAYRCHLMRVSGSSWEMIAEIEKYPSGQAAKYDVDRYMEEGRALVVESSQRQMLTMEVARLDRLQLAVWEKAMEGNIPSVLAAMQIIMNRSKLVGLDAEKMNMDAIARTVVVPVDGDGYVLALKKLVGPDTKLDSPDAPSLPKENHND